jgi:hypothetical protein
MRDNSVAIYIYIYRCGHIVYNCYLSLSYLLVVAQPKDNNIIIFVVLHVVNHDVKIIKCLESPASSPSIAWASLSKQKK